MATVVIIGAGLASSLIASRLLARHRVVVIEQSARNEPLRVEDRGRPAVLDPHIGGGFGGTTYLWHNGLIELERSDYASWPLSASELQTHLAAAHIALSGSSLARVREIASVLEFGFEQVGVPKSLLGRPLFYPVKRRNVWRSEGLAESAATSAIGRVDRLTIDDAGRVHSAVVSGESAPIVGDVFILAAGGLGSPVILQSSGDGAFKNAGRFYYDHPAAFVGEITTRADFNLNPLWNRFDGALSGSVRLPLVIATPRQKFAFYLRPAGLRKEVKSVLSDLRNSPLDLRHYFRLLTHYNDIIEVLSLRAGINIPTRRFWLYMSAEQLPQELMSISGRSGTVVRDWQLDPEFFSTADEAIRRLLAQLAPLVERSTVFERWPESVQTGAHHSGTCRMSVSAEGGVCDKDGRVFGTSNLFVCDGSVLPAAGYANTGLTIGALALRLGQMIN